MRIRKIYIDPFTLITLNYVRKINRKRNNIDTSIVFTYLY